jgi:hypothetical protein
MKRETRIKFEQLEAEGRAAQAALAAVQRSPRHKHKDTVEVEQIIPFFGRTKVTLPVPIVFAPSDGVHRVCEPGCPMYEKQDRLVGLVHSLATEYRKLQRQLRAEEHQAYQNRKPSGPKAAAARTSAKQTRIADIAKAIGDKDPSARLLSKSDPVRAAVKTKTSLRTTQRDLQDIRKSRRS